MSNNSTQLDPAVGCQESLEFEFALRNKVVGQGKRSARSLRSIQVPSNEEK